MSRGELAWELSKLVTAHGARAVVEALRDACHAAGDHSADALPKGGPVAQNWQKAGDALGFAADDIDRAEIASVAQAHLIDLASALDVVADFTDDETNNSTEETRCRVSTS